MAGNLKDILKKKWLELPPKTRTAIAIGALFTGLVAVGSIFVHPGNAPRKQKVAPTVSNLLLPKPKDQTSEQLAAANKATNDEVAKIKTELDKSNDEKAALLKKIDEMQSNSAHPDVGVNSDMMKELMAMKSRLDDLEKSKGNGKTPGLNDPLPLPSAGGKTDDDAPVAAAQPEKPHLRVTTNTKAITKVSAKQDTTPAAYLTAGSMFEGILLNGMDAPTSSVAQKNPVPAVMRIKTDAILPNNYNHDVKECFVLVSGYGSLSSERAQLRTETLSCVGDGGKVLETKLDGYVVGEDGRVGARGRLVSKQGQLIAKSLAAGVLSGFSDALTPQQIPRLDLGSGSGYISTERATAGTIAETGVAKGFSTAAKSVAAFYLDMAKEMTPVVEIDAGRKLTIVLIKGVELK
ncbi:MULTISPECIES: TraB/VirB10 family protein [Caballeronia]|uniref:TraB/VirB10 family protein n=1 Tax=Caballeronia TaxID=1827195 RepID=UPI001FD4F2F4|nr:MULTISPECIES: TraB/VirB10 family protein [Caballeronia]MDR5799270.1 TraB/VirB10 family protein [Caballeronia sp. LZ001]